MPTYGIWGKRTSTFAVIAVWNKIELRYENDVAARNDVLQR